MTTNDRPKKSTGEDRTKALDLYLLDFSLQEISGKTGWNLTTLKNWSIKYKWVKKKKSSELKAQKNIFDIYRKKIEEICSKSLDGSRIVAHVSVEMLDQLRKKNASPDDKSFRDSFEAWAKILLIGTNVQKNAIPEAGGELSELILQELQKINDNSKEKDK